MRYDEVACFGDTNTDYLQTHYRETKLRLIIDGVRCLLHRVKVNGVIAAPLSDGHGRTDGPG
jgi:hypothetical protein